MSVNDDKHVVVVDSLHDKTDPDAAVHSDGASAIHLPHSHLLEATHTKAPKLDSQIR